MREMKNDPPKKGKSNGKKPIVDINIGAPMKGKPLMPGTSPSPLLSKPQAQPPMAPPINTKGPMGSKPVTPPIGTSGKGMPTIDPMARFKGM